jgi:hypothetical protein
MLRAHAEIMARTARAQIRVAAMIAENGERERHGFAQAYNETAIYNVIVEEGIDENQLVTTLNGGY